MNQIPEFKIEPGKMTLEELKKTRDELQAIVFRLNFIIKGREMAKHKFPSQKSTH